jgi:cytochrome c6
VWRFCRGAALALLLSIWAGVAPVWSLEATTSAAALKPDLARVGPAADLQAGARLFEAHCVGCHAGGGNVIRHGRTLRLDALRRADLASPEAIARVAAAGRGQMAGYGSVLGTRGAEQVAFWVWRQAQAGWPRNTSIPSAG